MPDTHIFDANLVKYIKLTKFMKKLLIVKI